jgi:triacylglycerol lipase
MTSFVEILPEEYDADAFNGFAASTADFTIGNARALMWFSQLAYETHRLETIEAVRTKWAFTSVSACRALAAYRFRRVTMRSWAR